MSRAKTLLQIELNSSIHDIGGGGEGGGQKGHC